MNKSVGRLVEITAEKWNKKKEIRNENYLRDFWVHQHSNYRSRRRRKEKVSENTFEDIIVKKFLNMGKEIVNQIQEVQRVLYRINPRRNTLRHMLIKVTKIKYKGRS